MERTVVPWVYKYHAGQKNTVCVAIEMEEVGDVCVLFEFESNEVATSDNFSF